MAMTEEQEQRVASHRAKNRQNKLVPWLIRDDGAIFPNVPNIAKKQNFKPYHGDINAPLAERLQYLAGAPGRRRVVMTAAVAEPEPFDISKASKDELIAFAMEEYSEPLDPDMHVNKMRAEVCKLAGLNYNELFGAGSKGAGLEKAAA